MSEAAAVKQAIDLKTAQISQDLMMVSMHDRYMSSDEQLILSNVNAGMEDIRQYSKIIGADGIIQIAEKQTLIFKIEQILAGSVEIAKEKGITGDQREILTVLKNHIAQLRSEIYKIKAV